MSTVPSSPAKAKSPAKGVETRPSSSTAAGAPSTRGVVPDAARTRRPPLSVLILSAAIVAACYGHFVLGMRFGPPLVMVGLGGLTLGLCAAALWRVIDPLTRNETVVAAEVRAPHRVRELEREKQAVLKAIKEIELDHQMRKISDADYREMVERYRARALRVMGDLAAGDDYRALIERELKDRLAAARAAASRAPAGATAGGIPADAVSASSVIASDPPQKQTATATATPAVGVSAAVSRPASACAGCGTLNDSDARFCKKCGNQLTTSADSA